MLLPLVVLNVTHPHFEFSDIAKLKYYNFLTKFKWPGEQYVFVFRLFNIVVFSMLPYPKFKMCVGVGGGI